MLQLSQFVEVRRWGPFSHQINRTCFSQLLFIKESKNQKLVGVSVMRMLMANMPVDTKLIDQNQNPYMLSEKKNCSDVQQ